MSARLDRALDAVAGHDPDGRGPRRPTVPYWMRTTPPVGVSTTWFEIVSTPSS